MNKYIFKYSPQQNPRLQSAQYKQKYPPPISSKIIINTDNKTVN